MRHWQLAPRVTAQRQAPPQARAEHARHTKGRDRPCGGQMRDLADMVDVGQQDIGHPARYGVPEFLEAADPPVGRVARDDRGVDRADRYARNPADIAPQFVQPFIDARLEGTQCAAPLKQERDFAG